MSFAVFYRVRRGDENISLSDLPELLEKCNAAFIGFREKIRAVKKGITSRSSAGVIDCYNQMCFDACQDLQDLAKELKKQTENA